MRYLYCLIICLPVVCFGQITLDRDRLFQLLKQGKTQQVLEEAQRLRKNVYGKCAIIDYFIAKSLCLDNHHDESKECFEYILQHYPLLQKSRDFINKEIQSCSRKEDIVRPAALTEVLNIPLPNAGVNGPLGKMGYVKDCMDSSQVPSYKNFKEEKELQSRLFDIPKSEAALMKIKSLMGDRYSVEISDRFILVFLKSQNVSQNHAIRVAQSLKRAYDFFISYYKLRMPDKYITVYLMPDFSSLATVATRIHGITLSRQTLGYSILADLSLLGIATPHPDDIGTLYHELWHLVVRTDVGDISPWLDEGMASLYSTSGWKGNQLFGEATWRTKDLRRQNFRRPDLFIPTLAELFTLDWEAFNGGNRKNFCQASINYSLANHFMLYLQERNFLTNVIEVSKNRRSPTSTPSSKINSEVSLIEIALNKKLGLIQRDFERWFMTKYSFSLYK